MTSTDLRTRTWNGLAVPLPGTFVIDPAHTRVGFTGRHMMISKVRGRFGEVSGEIVIAEEPTASSVQVAIKAASIETGSADRDAHLRSPDFLDVETFPELTFRSSRLAPVGGGFELVGELTIRDVTREVVLDVEFEGLARSPWQQEVVGFTAITELDREEWGMTWNQALESGGVLVGKKVKIELEVEAIRQG